MNEQKSTNPDFDDRYWQEALQGSEYFRPEIGVEGYRDAIRYGQHARENRGEEVAFDQVEEELRTGWQKFAPSSKLTWEQARGAVADAYTRSTKRADDIAQHAGFSKPPTFQDNGADVPRSIDEPNR